MSAQKSSETETRELKGGAEEKSVFLMRFLPILPLPPIRLPLALPDYHHRLWFLKQPADAFHLCNLLYISYFYRMINVNKAPFDINVFSLSFPSPLCSKVGAFGGVGARQFCHLR